MLLIMRAKKNPNAFGELYEKYYDEIFSFTYFRTKDKQTTEDLVSEIWEKALINLKNLNSNKETIFRIWLYKIARNTIYQHYREQPKALLPLPEYFDKPSEENLVENLKNNELKSNLEKLIKGLPTIQQEIITMRFFGELKNKEIAEILNESEKTVAVYISRALKALRNRIS